MGIFKSAYSAVYKAFRSLLVRSGVNVGGTAGYPRVELHSWTESGPMDKDGSIRRIDLTVESMSENSIAEAVKMTEDNLDLILQDAGVEGDFRLIGVVPVQLRDMTEVSDSNQVLYRILQTLQVYIENS